LSACPGGFAEAIQGLELGGYETLAGHPNFCHSRLIKCEICLASAVRISSWYELLFAGGRLLN
jgi:hypothetical protein